MTTAAGEGLAVRLELGRPIALGTVLDTVVFTPVEEADAVPLMSAEESGGREGLGRCILVIGIGDR